jgi:hypothetical protein
MDDAGDATAGVYDIYTFKGATLTLDEIGETPVAQPSQ